MTDRLVADFRAHGGAVADGPFAGRQLLLLTTTGARTGEARLVPLVYSRDESRLVVVASMGGADDDPAWYANLVANPTVTVEVGGETFMAQATPAVGEDRDRLYTRHAAENPKFLEDAGRTSRAIPVILLDRLE